MISTTILLWQEYGKHWLNKQRRIATGLLLDIISLIQYKMHVVPSSLSNEPTLTSRGDSKNNETLLSEEGGVLHFTADYE